ncbi:MAG: aminopeptidase P family protein [Alphaproteobacteria bacterium]|nr:aminopeptidase P family protein [Alphaproteobacteria bacterium]
MAVTEIDVTAFAKRAPGMGLKDHETQIDMGRMRRYRLGRVQGQLKAKGCAAALLFDSINMRYATGSRSAQIFQLHTPYRACLVPAEGKAVLYDLGGGWGEGAEALGTIAELRDSHAFCFFLAGDRFPDLARAFAADVAAVVKRLGLGDLIAVDRMEPVGLFALVDEGLKILNGQQVMDRARMIKSADEIACMAHAIAVAESGMARMRETLRPGITEQQLWAKLHEVNIAHGGEWIEYRLLNSGGKANPWGGEAGDRIIRAGELVAFDCGMVGPFGYCADVSRTFFCHPGKPSPAQRALYRLAAEVLDHNLAMIRPGLTYRDLTDKGFRLPLQFVKNRYPQVAHGIGMGDEYPSIAYPEDWARTGYDGVVEPGMALCIEAYIGSEGGSEGVKLEQQVAVTESGYQLLSTFPLEDELLAP